MSIGNGQKSIDQEIDHVRECIEKCMQMYMNKRETVNFLATQGNIQAAVTRIVWARLERDNPDFFRAYYIMIAVQEQIIEFNKLLPAQVELMRRIALTGNTSVFNSSLPHTTPYRNVDLQESRHSKPENMQQVYVINNYGPSIQGNLDRPFQIREINDVYPNMFLPQYTNAGFEQTENMQIFGDGQSDLSFARRSNLMVSNPPRSNAFLPYFNSNNMAQHSEGFHLNYGIFEQHHQLNSAAAEYPVDYSSGSSGLSLPSNAAPHYVDNFLFKDGVCEQYHPTPNPEYPVDSLSSTGNAEILDPGSSGSLKNPFSG
ncbi:hypothetical protein STAS_17948 [Striga asiatica]|uniref:Uncharacterized protein n=1 Tax=Striga asiatica TaxID=4170 RepID=A0A5A7QB22_STRAF|nr:hypothetical protein STAS_17948 [Striga asiatica]